MGALLRCEQRPHSLGVADSHAASLVSDFGLDSVDSFSVLLGLHHYDSSFKLVPFLFFTEVRPALLANGSLPPLSLPTFPRWHLSQYVSYMMQCWLLFCRRYQLLLQIRIIGNLDHLESFTL